MIPVKFVAQELGTAKTGAAGVCMLDVDGDGRWDLISLSEGDAAVRVFRNLGEGKFKEVSASEFGLALKGKGVSCAVGDYDNDGKNDLAVALSDRVILFHNDGGGKFTDVTAKVGISTLNEPAGMTFVDYDHDGDLDLFVTGKRLAGSKTRPTYVVWRNNGNSTFTNWTKEAGFAGEGATTSVVLSDINNDRAVDLVIAGFQGSPNFFLNQREGPFKFVGGPYDQFGEWSPTVGVFVFDFNKDGRMDIAMTHSGPPGISLWRNVDGIRFENVLLPMTDVKRGWGITAIDFDNDGWIDLAAVVETGKGPELRVLRNKGTQGFEDVSAALGLDKLKLHNPRALIAADLDNDLAADLVVTQLGGDPVVLHNDGGNKNHALRIDLKGLADNKTGLGTKVEVFCQRSVAEVRSRGRRGLSEPGAARDSRRVGQEHERGHRAHAVADRRAARRDRCRGEQAGVVHGTRPAWQLVSDAVCVDWREVRVHH